MTPDKHEVDQFFKILSRDIDNKIHRELI